MSNPTHTPDEPVSSSRPSTHNKTLEINLNSAHYGTFAEIGGGQEVARWFFHVGGAAGTVAETVSAYDMTVSDLRYGHADRYVSRDRLHSMLDFEYRRLVEELDAKRGAKTAFFVFANTVATRSFSHRENGHGWMGVRFQTQPRSEPSEIIIHVHLLDVEYDREQEALGVLGVNLIYGAFYCHHDPRMLIESLVDNLARQRIELDMVKFSGPAFAGVDNRLMSLQLVEKELTSAAMFMGTGEVLQPSEALYKKPILIERGSFRPITHLTLDMLERAQEQFLQEPQVHGEPPVVLMEMTLRNLSAGGAIDHEDFLARVDLLSVLGKTVLVSNFGPYFHLTEYLTRHTQKMIGIVVGIPSLQEFWNEKYYTDLRGGTVESVGRLFKNLVKVYVYPARDPTTEKVITAETVPVNGPMAHLYAFLLEDHRVEPIRQYNEAFLSLMTKDVLSRIQKGDASWETMVPPAIVETIKKHKLFSSPTTLPTA